MHLVRDTFAAYDPTLYLQQMYGRDVLRITAIQQRVMFFRHVPRARMRLGQSRIRSRNSCNIHLWRSTHRTSASIVSSYVKVALLPTSSFSSSFLYSSYLFKDICGWLRWRKTNVGRIKSSLHSCIINHAISGHARKSLAVGELRLCSGVGVGDARDSDKQFEFSHVKGS